MPEGSANGTYLPSDAEVRSRFADHVARANEYVLPLGLVALGLAAVAGVNALLVPPRASASLCVAIASQLLAAVLVGGVAAISQLRAAVVQEALEAVAAARGREQRRAEGKSLFATVETPEESSAAEAALLAHDRTFQPLGLGVLCLGVAAIAVLALVGAPVGLRSTAFYVVGALNLAVAFLCMVTARWLQHQPEDHLPEALAAGTMLRATQWCATLGAVGLLAHGVGADAADLWLGRVLLVIVAVLCGEQVAGAILSFLGRARTVATSRMPIASTVAASLFSGVNPITATLELLEQRFGVSLQSSYALGYVRRVAPLALIGIPTVFWATTALVCIRPEEVGVLTRFGALPAHGWLGPGLHLTAPWPIDRVERLPAERIQTVKLGAGSDTELPYLLWSRTHTEEEYKLVLGQGRELVSLDARIFFRIKDPVDFTIHFQNPYQALVAFAYRAMMREIVSSDLDYVLAEGRRTFSTRLRHALQRDLDAQRMGVDIVKVALRGIHPPVEVAQAYQAVVSAQVERVTLETQAEGRRAEAVPAAEAAKHTAIRKAQATAETRLADARGEAIRFRSVEAAYSVSPDLYRRRQWLENVEDALAGKEIYLVERHPTREREYWVDLRKGTRLP